MFDYPGILSKLFFPVVAWQFRQMLERSDPVIETVVGALHQRLTPSTCYADVPRIVAMIGLVGSGKSTVAREIATKIGAAVIESDAIRVRLREYGLEEEEGVLLAIRARLACRLLEKGCGVILDEDHVTVESRALAEWLAARFNAPLFYIRTVCGLALQKARIQNADYPTESVYRYILPRVGVSEKLCPADTCLDEMMYYIGLHYRFTESYGGQYTLRSFHGLPGMIALRTDDESWYKALDRAMKRW